MVILQGVRIPSGILKIVFRDLVATFVRFKDRLWVIYVAMRENV